MFINYFLNLALFEKACKDTSYFLCGKILEPKNEG